jgi:signal transduction histidine kinase/ActR/RegA family two-component response regulator
MEEAMSKRALNLLQVLGFSALMVASAAVIRACCAILFNESIPYTPFYPAVVAATIYGHLRGGLVTVALAAFAASFWLIPFGRPMITEPSDLIGLVLFVLVSALVVALCEGMRRARIRAETAAAERQQALQREQVARKKADESNRLKDEFLACVSHELRTPLQAILGWTQLLAEPNVDAEAIQEGVDVISRNAKVQAHLVEDLLDIGRLVSGKMRLAVTAVNPRTALASAIQTVSLAARAKRIEIIRSFDSEHYGLLVDPDRFQQILWNLLSNAIKFSPSDSCIKVSLHRVEAGVRLQVIDQGCGLEPEFAPFIFDRFSQADPSKTRRHGGLGLGLSIVKNLVELHGGTIEAASAGIDQGTTMTILLPNSVTRIAALDSHRPTRRSRLQGVRVLVVDDDRQTCELVRRVLQEQQAIVTLADSAEEALHAVEREVPDVIVSDIAMPEQDGYQLLREIRSRRDSCRVPAMALTAYGSPSDRCRTFEAGYELHLTKPVEAQCLTEAVAELATSQR